MAEVIWAEPALNDLDVNADYIALDDPEAPRRLMPNFTARRATRRERKDYEEDVGS